MQWNTESDEGVEGALDDDGEKECLCQREATRSLSPNAKIARRVSFSFHCEISKNSIIINRGQGGVGGEVQGKLRTANEWGWSRLGSSDHDD